MKIGEDAAVSWLKLVSISVLLIKYMISRNTFQCNEGTSAGSCTYRGICQDHTSMLKTGASKQLTDEVMDFRSEKYDLCLVSFLLGKSKLRILSCIVHISVADVLLHRSQDACGNLTRNLVFQVTDTVLHLHSRVAFYTGF